MVNDGIYEQRFIMFHGFTPNLLDGNRSMYMMVNGMLQSDKSIGLIDLYVQYINIYIYIHMFIFYRDMIKWCCVHAEIYIHRDIIYQGIL